jgi:hypothetical protein
MSRAVTSRALSAHSMSISASAILAFVISKHDADTPGISDKVVRLYFRPLPRVSDDSVAR